MTESKLRLKVVNGITAYNGAVQGSSKHKEIIDIFNSSGLCSRYKMTYTDFWCAATASTAYIIAGLAGSGKGKIFPCVECSCSGIIKKATAAGIWIEKDSYIPKPADLIIYDWEDNGVGDNKGDPDHVGVVVSVSDGFIKVFEGNMGAGKCGYRNIPVNGRYIRGFVAPNFKNITTENNKIKIKSTGVIYRYAYKDILGKSSKALATVPAGKKVVWLEDDGWGWSQVKYNNITGWIYNTRLDMDGLSKFKTKTLKDDVKDAIIIIDNRKKGKTITIKKGTKYTLYCIIERGEYKGKKYIGIGGKRYYI